MLDLTYEKFSKGYRVTGTIPIRDVISMMERSNATNFICHALLNIIKGLDTQEEIASYGESYFLEYIYDKADAQNKKILRTFCSDVIRQVVGMWDANCSEPMPHHYLIKMSSGDLLFDINFSRLAVLRKIHTADPDAKFQIDLMTSGDGYVDMISQSMFRN